MKNINSVFFAKALADETRQQIMKLCCCRELSVNEIAEQTGVSQPTVSHHLAILRDADLVSLRSAGRQTYYTLNQERIAVCCGQLLQVFAPESEVTEVVKTVCEC
jgi:ArsR family transcriptional regulator, arsenate/arsenite/antimonite-responsive transcriptional repressor